MADPRNTNARFDKRPNLAKAGDPRAQDFGVHSQTQSAKEAATGPAFGYDQSKPGGMTFGKSSSYNVSSGLVNMLDVTKGVTEIVGKTNKAMETLDRNKATRLGEELAAKKNEDGWELKDPAEQMRDMQKIQDGYADGWHTAKGRTDFRTAQSSMKFAAAKHDLESGLQLASLEVAESYASGDKDPNEIWTTAERRYQELLSTHGQDPIKRTRIMAAMQEQRAASEAARTQTINTTFERMKASDEFQSQLLMMRPDLGYDEWRKMVMTSAMEFGGEGFALALGSEYNEEDDTFSGDYSESMTKRIDYLLEPLYQEKLKIEQAASVRQAGVDSQTHLMDLQAPWAVAGLTSGDGAVSAEAMGEQIDTFGLMLTSFAQTTTDPSVRAAYAMDNLPKIVAGQLGNSDRPETEVDTIKEAWQEIIKNEEFQNNLFAYLGIADDDEEGKTKAIQQAATQIGAGFKVFKDRRTSTANDNGQGKDTPPNLKPLGAETDSKTFDEARKSSLLNKARTGTSTLMAAPVDEESYGTWAAQWQTLAAEAAFARSLTDPNYTAEQALEFKLRVASAFDGVTTIEEGRAAADRLAIDMKAEVFTEDYPFDFSQAEGGKDGQPGDWLIRSKGKSADATTVALASAMTHMAQTPVEGRMVLDLKDITHGAYNALWKDMADKYVQAFAQDGMDTTAVSAELMKDAALYFDLFGDAGTDIFISSAMTEIVNRPEVTVSDEHKKQAKKALGRIFDTFGKEGLSPAQQEEVGKILRSLESGKGFAYDLDIKNPYSTSLTFVGDEDGEADQEFIDTALGSGVLGSLPDGSHRGRDTGVWESFTDWAFQLTGGMIPGRDADSQLIGAALRQPANAQVFTGMLSNYLTRNPDSQLGSVDGGTVSLNMTFIDDNPMEASKAIGLVVESSGYEFIPTYGKDGEVTGGAFQRAMTSQKKDPNTGKWVDGPARNYSGPIEKTLGANLATGATEDDLGVLSINLEQLSGGSSDTARVEAQLASPVYRRAIEQWGASTQAVFRNPGALSDLADKVDAQVAVLSNAQIGIQDSVGRLVEFAAEARGGRVGEAGRYYYQRAQEMAKAQGIKPGKDGDVGQFFLLAAMAEDAYDLTDWPINPMALTPTQYDHYETEGHAHGLANYRFTLDKSFQVSGSGLEGEIEIPLFAPSRRSQDRGLAFDPRFFAAPQAVRPYAEGLFVPEVNP